ncbi:YhcB family protein [Larsenimonas salina]|uniref:YhcB family protein n=1 Tax=Larsenimonas salina TaxID=1295565 RepID=UPI002072D3BF|nr:YhcB family protein [Larsenimonas salina]
MNDGNIDWILALACLLAGIGIGAVGYHLLNANVRRNQKVRQRLSETELQLGQVRDALNNHFSQATDLVTQLQRTSQELQQQLTAQADALCDDPQLKRRLHQNDDESPSEEDTSLHAPRDYAESGRGTLSENYGMQNKAPENDPQPPRY